MKVYIIFSNCEKINAGEYGTYSPTIEYLSLDQSKVKEVFEKERNKYFNIEGCEIDENLAEEFGCQVGNWWYHYWIKEYPLDEFVK